MTKKDLQQELLQEVKEGVKPSDLKRKLKRSKSADDIVNIPVAPPNLLQDQLNQKQQELELLRKQKEDSVKQIKELKKQLDQSLEARTNSLKDWTKQQEQIKALSKELDDTVNQASQELTAGDDEISQLRQKVYQLKSAKEQLERELKLSRINRPSLPLTTNDYETKLDYFQAALYALLAVWFVLVLNNSWNTEYSLNTKVLSETKK